MSGILRELNIPAAHMATPGVPMLKNQFRNTVRNLYNVIQWRFRFQRVYGMTSLETQDFGTRQECTVEAFNRCPFA